MKNYLETHPFLIHLFCYGLISLAIAFQFKSDQHQDDQIANFTVDLRDGLVTSCEINGDKVREEINKIEDILDTVLAAARTDPVLYPPPPVTAEEKTFIDAVETGMEELKGIDSVDCQAQYPEGTLEE